MLSLGESLMMGGIFSWFQSASLEIFDLLGGEENSERESSKILSWVIKLVSPMRGWWTSCLWWRTHHTYRVSRLGLHNLKILGRKRPLSNYLNNKWKPAQITKSPQGLKCLLSWSDPSAPRMSQCCDILCAVLLPLYIFSKEWERKLAESVGLYDLTAVKISQLLYARFHVNPWFKKWGEDLPGGPIVKLHAPHAGGPSLVPVWGTRSHRCN